MPLPWNREIRILDWSSSPGKEFQMKFAFKGALLDAECRDFRMVNLNSGQFCRIPVRYRKLYHKLKFFIQISADPSTLIFYALKVARKARNAKCSGRFWRSSCIRVKITGHICADLPHSPGSNRCDSQAWITGPLTASQSRSQFVCQTASAHHRQLDPKLIHRGARGIRKRTACL